ncbi:MAG: multifunctional CCA addition/repair protein [Gammaproteobacteria bacterium]
MRIYLVGGAVRNQLLGLPVQERDWVVVGSTPQALLNQGYKQVGKDFPVFLDPKHHEEYALARKERKSGRGYHGFICEFGPEVSLEEDLLRRDLTINAMAQDSEGRIIDPHGGLQDLNNRVLRHVSPAFVEDPLRVLRVARFAARFADLKFSIAEETLSLMRNLVLEQELLDLSAERIWLEFSKALLEKRPRVFFEVLKQIGALEQLFPALDRLFGVPQSAQWHPEIDTGIHVMMALDIAASLSEDPVVRFAALCHDLGKGTTDPAMLPKHHGHEARGVPLVRAFARRYKISKTYEETAALTSKQHLSIHRIEELKSATIWKVLKECDALRKPERFLQILLACEADARGRLNFEERPYPQRQIWADLLQAVLETKPDPAHLARLKNPIQIAGYIRTLQIQAIAGKRPSKKLT